MSYARWGEDDSDVYVYLAIGGGLRCENHEPTFEVWATAEMLAHLEEHRVVGERVTDETFAELRADAERNDRLMALSPEEREREWREMLASFDARGE